MENKIDKNISLGRLVTIYPPVTEMLNQHKIDYCCGGDMTLEDALREKGINVNLVLPILKAKIKKYESSSKKEIQYDSLSNEDLIDLIIGDHHVKELKLIDELDLLIKKIFKVHYDEDGENLGKLYRVFSDMKKDLEYHFIIEERDLFPRIIDGEAGIYDLLLKLEEDHDTVGDFIKEIQDITNDFTPGAYACPSVIATYDKLKELTEDIFLHIHKENSILFPRLKEDKFEAEDEKLEYRKLAIKNIIKRLHHGESVEDVKDEFNHSLAHVSAREIADAERALILDGFPVEEIQSLCNVHAEVFQGSIEEIHGRPLNKIPGHPAFVLGAENMGIRKFISEKLIPAYEDYKLGKENNFKVRMEELRKIDKHYARKENLLFPYLEDKGISAPPKVMWAVDDDIRALIKSIILDLDQEKETFEVIKATDCLLNEIESMIVKEDSILMPLLLENITDDQWLIIARESREIGYVFNGGIEGGSPSDSENWITSKNKKQPALEDSKPQASISLPSGYFNLNELESLLNTLPCDITFVGADGRVHYFSENPERVFPRTRTIIGRDVNNCHPPKSLHMVEKIIEDFKNGLKSSESFWINKGDIFILIRYYALRDENNKYLGVLEVTEEVGSIRKLEGSKTLLD